MRARSVLARILASTSLATLAACSLVVDTNADQCQTDGDCAAKGTKFQGTACIDRVCRTPPAPPHQCDKNADCTAKSGGAPAICKPDFTCATLTSPDCQDVFGSATTDGAIIYGFLGPLKGDSASSGVPVRDAAALALDEITKSVGGIPSPNGGKPRPVAMVACHDQDDLDRAATHLVKDVGVPVVIGPIFSGDVVKAATDVTIPAGVLLMTPSATATTISMLPNKNGLVWRTCPSDVIQAQALAAVVPQTEAKLRAAEMLGTQPIKVAMTVKGDTYGTGLADAITATLRFNGADVKTNDTLFVRKQYDPSPTATIDWKAIVDAIVAPVQVTKPTATTAHLGIVILIGTNEAITNVLQGVELAIAQTTPAPPKPYYVISDGGELPELLDAIQKNDALAKMDDLRKRVIGTVPGHANPNRDAFVQRFKGKYDVTPGAYAENGYDAAYAVTYATVAAAGGPLTGATIAAGLKKLVPPGMPLVPVGPGGIDTAFMVLGGGGAIDLDGASGHLDWDVTTGDPPADIDVWCVDHGTTAGQLVFASSGEYFDATAGTITGAQTCP